MSRHFRSDRLMTGKSRRESGGFIGAETVLQQLKDGPKKRRVGFIVEEAPARGTPWLLVEMNSC